MESGTNLNKGEGLAGKSKADDLRAFMHKSQTKTRRAIEDLKNPNASFDVHKTHGSGPDVDHTRVSTVVGSRNLVLGIRISMKALIWMRSLMVIMLGCQRLLEEHLQA
ncbi:hypothetical protein Tco_0282179 [Tanacetum coccineum]